MLGPNVCGQYQASGIGTQKWHLLDHLIDNIKHVRGAEYLHGGSFQSLCRNFKCIPKDLLLNVCATNDALRKTVTAQQSGVRQMHVMSY